MIDEFLELYTFFTNRSMHILHVHICIYVHTRVYRRMPVAIVFRVGSVRISGKRWSDLPRGGGVAAALGYHVWCVYVHVWSRWVSLIRLLPRNSLFGSYFCGLYAGTSRREYTWDAINRFLEDRARYILRSLTHVCLHRCGRLNGSSKKFQRPRHAEERVRDLFPFGAVWEDFRANVVARN